MNRGKRAVLRAGWVLALGSGAAATARAGATLEGETRVDARAVSVSGAFAKHRAGDQMFCEARWTEDASGAESFRARYEVDTPVEGWLYGACAGAAAPQPGEVDTEQLVILRDHRYVAIAAPEEEPASYASYVEPLQEYARAPSDATRATAFAAQLPNPDSPTIHSAVVPGRTTVWLPRLHCDKASIVYVYRPNGGDCGGAVQRNALLSSPPQKLNYNSDAIPPPKEVAAQSLAEQYGARTARFEWLSSAGKASHCSGLFLSPTIVLTARHCVEDVEAPKLSCLGETMYCQSYAVDVDVGAEGESVSVAVKSAVAGPPGTTADGIDDYALVSVFPSHAVQRLERTWPKLGVMPASPSDLWRGAPLALLSYPLGYHLLESSNCEVFHPGGRAGSLPALLTGAEQLYHTCYALEGSSGGPIFAPAPGSLLSPVALATAVVRPCDDPDGSQWEAAKGKRQSEAWFKTYMDPNTNLSTTKCVVQAVQVKRVLCQKCAGTPRMRECADMLAAFPGFNINEQCSSR